MTCMLAKIIIISQQRESTSYSDIKSIHNHAIAGQRHDIIYTAYTPQCTTKIALL